MSAALVMFAVGVEGTNLYLPARDTARGSSYDVPEEDGGRKGPRFFRTRRSASAALAAWKIGPWDPVKDSEQNEYTGESFSYTVGAEPQRDPERAATPLVVVEFELIRK